MQIVLIRPQIATNTGNIIRLCANIGASLALVEPLGFDLDDAKLRRAGLDYHELTNVTVHPTIAALDRAPARWTFTADTTLRYDKASFSLDDQFVFGSEQPGLTSADHHALSPATPLRLPMAPNNRSLNLANAVAVVAYEAWRQHDFEGAALPGADSSGDRPRGLTAERLNTGPFDI